MSKIKYDLIYFGILVLSLLLFTPYKLCWGDELQYCKFDDWYAFFHTFVSGRARSIDFLRLFVQEGIIAFALFLIRRYKYSNR